MYTNFQNALLELLKGRKIRNCNWDKTEYIKLENGTLRDFNNCPCELNLSEERSIRYLLAYQWEVLPTVEELLITKGKVYDIARLCHNIETCEYCPMCEHCEEIPAFENEYFVNMLTGEDFKEDEWFSKYMLTINEMWDKLNKGE